MECLRRISASPDKLGVYAMLRSLIIPYDFIVFVVSMRWSGRVTEFVDGLCAGHRGVRCGWEHEGVCMH